MLPAALALKGVAEQPSKRILGRATCRIEDQLSGRGGLGGTPGIRCFERQACRNREKHYHDENLHGALRFLNSPRDEEAGSEPASHQVGSTVAWIRSEAVVFDARRAAVVVKWSGKRRRGKAGDQSQHGREGEPFVRKH